MRSIRPTSPSAARSSSRTRGGVGPGDAQFARTPLRAISYAIDFVNAITPPLAAA